MDGKEKTTVGEWVVIYSSIIIASITAFSMAITTGSFILIPLTFCIYIIISFIILYLIYLAITKLVPDSKNWEAILWIFSIGGIAFIYIIIILINIIIILINFTLFATEPGPIQFKLEHTIGYFTIPTVVVIACAIFSIIIPRYVIRKRENKKNLLTADDIVSKK